ncbi:ATP-binding protein [Legionella anisa]|nr:ATP-binding protein [Legionella anisa]
MDRGNRRISDLLCKARLLHMACVEDIDYQHPMGLEKSKIAVLTSCDFIRATTKTYSSLDLLG